MSIVPNGSKLVITVSTGMPGPVIIAPLFKYPTNVAVLYGI